ncbi:hypothetical protein D3C87_31560 [compost metagenome]
MEIRSMHMKSKSLAKIVTLVFFFSLLTFFVLFQSGFIVRRSKQVNYSGLHAKNTSLQGDSLKKKNWGLTTVQKLNILGAFDPENFDAMFIPSYVIPNETHLSSSKTIIIDWDHTRYSSRDDETYLKTLLKKQFTRKKEKP